VQLTLCFFRNQEVGSPHEAEQQPHDQQVGMHHAGHVERNFRKQEITPYILQAHNQTEQDLADKQANGSNKVGFCDRLRFVLQHDSPLSPGYSAASHGPS
jgi:hypothetical protein